MLPHLCSSSTSDKRSNQSRVYRSPRIRSSDLTRRMLAEVTNCGPASVPQTGNTTNNGRLYVVLLSLVSHVTADARRTNDSYSATSGLDVAVGNTNPYNRMRRGGTPMDGKMLPKRRRRNKYITAVFYSTDFKWCLPYTRGGRTNRAALQCNLNSCIRETRKV